MNIDLYQNEFKKEKIALVYAIKQYLLTNDKKKILPGTKFC